MVLFKKRGKKEKINFDVDVKAHNLFKKCFHVFSCVLCGVIYLLVGKLFCAPAPLRECSWKKRRDKRVVRV